MRGINLAVQCALVCNGGIADCSSVPDNVKLTWVDDEGTALQGDRFKITSYRTHSTLSLELQKSDHNRRWRCNLTEGGAVKASYSYTTTLTGSADRISPLQAGSNATLTCSLTCGFVCPPAKLLWSDSNGSSLQGGAREGFLIRSNITNSQLFVTGLQSSEQIRCSVEEDGKQRVYLQYLIQVSAPENLVLIATASAAAIALLIVLILAVAFCIWKRRRSDSDNHVLVEYLTKESVSEIPAQVTGGAGENYSSIQFNNEGRGLERRQVPAEESNGIIYSAIK
ncbi:hypothetical protein HHUSO_G31893 [Huso huso]|uniref:Ig-like domain-containing protein n=1 Tax=Huso huso TaxID=61971 RepID=A0ABR0YAD0_HUSHU